MTKKISLIGITALSLAVACLAVSLPAMAGDDTTPPSVSCSLATATLSPPNHDLINVGLTVSVSDDTDPEPVVTLGVFSDEDDLEPASNEFSPDGIAEKDVVRLRAERSGLLNGRVYLILVTATDASGNSKTICCASGVPHSQSSSSLLSLSTQMMMAESECNANGKVPNGFLDVTDGPIVGLKQ